MVAPGLTALKTVALGDMNDDDGLELAPTPRNKSGGLPAPLYAEDDDDAF